MSIGVNVVSRGSPSRIRIVRRISLGITTLPRSLRRRTIPVAVPDFFQLCLSLRLVVFSLTNRGIYIFDRVCYNLLKKLSCEVNGYAEKLFF